MFEEAKKGSASPPCPSKLLLHHDSSLLDYDRPIVILSGRRFATDESLNAMSLNVADSNDQGKTPVTRNPSATSAELSMKKHR